MNAILKGTHVRDFVLKTIGGATAPKTQKRMHTYLETMGKKRIKALNNVSKYWMRKSRKYAKLTP